MKQTDIKQPQDGVKLDFCERQMGSLGTYHWVAMETVSYAYTGILEGKHLLWWTS